MAARVVEPDNGRCPTVVLGPALSSTDLVYFITNNTELTSIITFHILTSLEYPPMVGILAPQRQSSLVFFPVDAARRQRFRPGSRRLGIGLLRKCFVKLETKLETSASSFSYVVNNNLQSLCLRLNSTERDSQRSDFSP